MPYVDEQFEQDGYRLTIQMMDYSQDYDPRDEDSNLGVIVANHRRYTLGDRKPTDAEDRAIYKAVQTGNWEPLKRLLRLTEHAVEILPLSLYDHGNIALRVGQPSDPWDSGIVGFTYATREKVEEMGAPLDSIARQLTGEVEEYSAWLNGEVYEFVIEKVIHCETCDDTKYEEIEDGQCGGYYEAKYAREEAVSTLASHIAWEAKKVVDKTAAVA